MEQPSQEQLRAARDRWRHRGTRRPSFADAPGPGQESVWDYPRPPAVVPDARRIQIWLDNHCVADTTGAYRILETAGAPTFYLPPEAFEAQALAATDASSFCEWKGRARYWDVRANNRVARRAAWDYSDAGGRFAAVAGFIACYAHLLACFVDGERARPQPGHFYGGWVTHDVVGPFKGAPGTQGW